MKNIQRGRPRKYQEDERRRFAELIRQHGARQTREALGRSMSVRTLLAIARDFGITLPKGRKRKSA